MKLLLAFAFAVLMMPVAAMAADESQQATAAAKSWLALVDAGNFAESWKQASTLFQNRKTEWEWTQVAKPIHATLGAVISRVPNGVDMETSLPGAPDGRYAIVRFKTKFEKKADATETVTMMLEGNAWKAAGYFIN